jgi:hypothetical protein
VADEPGRWVDIVARACRDEYPVEDDDLCITGDFDFALLTDVPDLTQHFVQHLAQDGEVGGGHQRCDRAALGVGLVQMALDERLEESELWGNPWPSVSAALCDMSVVTELANVLTSAETPALRRLTGSLPRPAADVCALLADTRLQAA